MIERRNTPSPLYLSVTFLAREMRSARSCPGSSYSRSASSNVIGSSFTRSLSDTTPRMEIVSPPLEQFWFLDYRNGICCQQQVGGRRVFAAAERIIFSIIFVIVETLTWTSDRIINREGFFELLKVSDGHKLYIRRRRRFLPCSCKYSYSPQTPLPSTNTVRGEIPWNKF